jgi:dGTPase
LRRLFDFWWDHVGELPDGGGVPGSTEAQRVTDYIAGMTDRFCIRQFEELTVPREFRY